MSQHHIFIDARFAAYLAANMQQVQEAQAAGTLPDYRTFVDRLFKEIMTLDVNVMRTAILTMANDESLAPDGKLDARMVVDMLESMAQLNPNASAMHAAIGCAGEGGELLDCVKKVFIYGKDWVAPDSKTGQTALENLVEELGDFRFYYQKLLNMLGLSDEDIQAANFVKLSKRYASGHYTDAQALARADKAHEPQYIGDKTSAPLAPPPARQYIGKPDLGVRRRASDSPADAENNDEHGPEGHHNLS